MTAREKDILARATGIQRENSGWGKIPYTVKHFILFYFIIFFNNPDLNLIAGHIRNKIERCNFYNQRFFYAGCPEGAYRV